MSVTHTDVVAMLRELMELTILDEQDPQSFRVRAYENAKRAVESHPDVTTLSLAELVALPGIGKSTAQKIREFIEHERVDKLETLRERYPPAFVQLSRVGGIGPKTARKLREALGVESLAELRQAIADQRIRELKGFGAKRELRIAEALDALGEAGDGGRTPIARVLPLAERLLRGLREAPSVQRAEICGSVRRLRETIGDVDIIAVTEDPDATTRAFLALPDLRRILGSGSRKTSVVTAQGIQVDLRVVPPESFGAATLYFTGSKAHNVKLRQRALARGWTLNEYGLYDADERLLAGATEEDVYRALELAWVPPPMREDTGEIERAAAGDLPRAPTAADLKGDLHVHTDLSGDGRSPLHEVVAHAAGRGYTYLAITDHAEGLPRIGVDRAAMLHQRDQLARLRDVAPLRVLHGVELNIGPDGELDWDADFRRGFEWRLAGIHSHFDLDRETQTRRLLRAIEDPTVDAIAHISGRMIGRRAGVDFDVIAVMKAAARTDTAIELNSALPRLDAATEVLRVAAELGVTLIINTDAHHVDEFDRVRYGVQHAARGWVHADRVANTWPADRFLKWLSDRRASA